MATTEISDLTQIADHPVLNLLNTVPMVDGALVDSLQADADVLAWLSHAGFRSIAKPPAPRNSLLQAARHLREQIRTAIEDREAGNPINRSVLNRMLSQGSSHAQLIEHPDGTFTTERIWPGNTPQQLLAPVAEAAADLLAHGDFNLIRRCEDTSCVLWFYDRTKSHQRRWCSMASCGNRNKVAAFRKRQQSEAL
ncbi:CGNR zinc finger domain-containing protein [Granulicella tundricola]|uniref:Zinc finger CGNR domain-containing protein n=1 Tax=Granulicella tundricola (strain ATCC BAA-1859 / DSM 23138 / MP5ACTX9) TaxID=1198114 RepID=E8WZX7_GRATM|nr:ABATE domain-containing protein [Granulicella tundricola]ADW67788.1 protein of unknown function DUF1470 [Granulicella tundricola MP5ACTX9]